MVIEVLGQKYRCGCERGMSAVEEDELLVKLNTIIEWDFCRFPIELKETDEDEEVVVGTDDQGNEVKETRKKVVEAENREFLGPDPELKPGNVFLFKGQVIAVDSPTRLVLIVSETGYGALDRIYEENIKTEIDLLFNDYIIDDVTYNVLEDGKIPPEYDEVYPVPYNLYKIWKERFLEGRGFLEKGLALQVTMDAEDFVFPLDFVMTDWNVRYKSTQLEPDEVGIAVKELLSWFYENFRRIKALERKQESSNS